MNHPTKQLHFYIYDKSPEFRSYFQMLLAHQGHNEGAFALGGSSSPAYTSHYAIQVTVITNTMYFHTFSIDGAVHDLKIGAIVSPGNSFGRMEGGFDWAINQFYSSILNRSITQAKLTAALQTTLQRVSPHTMAYNPPQHAIRIPGHMLLSTIGTGEPVGASSHPQARAQQQPPPPPPPYHLLEAAPDLVHLPTGPTPGALNVNSAGRLCDSAVFNCTWSLVSTLADSHIFSPAQTVEPSLNILLTGLGTGSGQVPHPVAALHMFKALYYYATVLYMNGKATTEADYIAISNLLRAKLQ